MGLFADLKNLRNLSKLYSLELTKQLHRDQVVSKGVTEEILRELMRQADTGVVAELSFPSGVTLKITRTLTGMATESPGINFREDF